VAQGGRDFNIVVLFLHDGIAVRARGEGGGGGGVCALGEGGGGGGVRARGGSGGVFCLYLGLQLYLSFMQVFPHSFPFLQLGSPLERGRGLQLYLRFMQVSPHCLPLLHLFFVMVQLVNL